MAFTLEERPYLRPYEGVILVHPDATEDEQKALFTRNKSIIEQQFGGSVKHLDTWGKRNLSNPIEKLKKAFYFHTTFEANPQAIAELERTMRINDRVLRFMHTRLEEETDLNQHLEDFRKALADSAAREREREAKFQARKAAQRGSPRGDRGGRDDEGGGDRPSGGPGAGPGSRPGGGPGSRPGGRPGGGFGGAAGADEGADDES